MATILEFRRTAEPAPRVMDLKDRAFGQIIIFPGVRIERRAYEGTPGGTAGTPRKRAQRAEEATLSLFTPQALRASLLQRTADVALSASSARAVRLGPESGARIDGDTFCAPVT